MRISPPTHRPLTAGVKKPKNSEKPEAQEELRVPFKEHLITSSIVGASLGTMGGEKVGQLGIVGGAGYIGYAIGSSFGAADIGGVIGGAIGAGTGYFIESKVPIGRTIGGALGFVSGGLVGGVTGTLIAGTTRVLDLNPFK